MNSRIRHKARRFGVFVGHGFSAALLSLLLFSLVGAVPAMASVLQVPPGYPTIQAALDAAEDFEPPW
ncbi:MAG: hypothetical protein KA184_10090 [Candidatus Hydrogenedentes bacterium]|nr:hypothetical protein [Candidatus Hydrogenedentota bacterium]